MRAAAREIDGSGALVMAHNHNLALPIETRQSATLVTLPLIMAHRSASCGCWWLSNAGVAMLAGFIVASACGNGFAITVAQLARFERRRIFYVFQSRNAMHEND
jgi:hypothetical protein